MLEALGSLACAQEALPVGFGVGLGFGLGLAPVIDGGVAQTEQDPPNGSQDARGVGIAHAAQILLHGQVQAVMQTAFNDPILAFEPQHPLGLQLFQRQAADEVNGFLAPLALAQHPGLEPRDQTGSGKARLARVHFDQFEPADFRPPPVVLLNGGLGPGAGFGGKNTVG